VLRVALGVVLLIAGGVALQGRMPGPRTATEASAADDSGSLVAVIAMLGVSFVVMAFAMFARRPPTPKYVPYEMPDFGGGEPGRMNRRLLLIVFAVVVLWLGIFVAASQFRLESDYTLPTPPPTSTVTPDSASQPAAQPQPERPRSDTYRLLLGATAVLLVMMVVATVVTALRNRSTLPPVALTGRPEGAESQVPEPLALAAERGLAEVANPALEPREAIIACYAAMEQALAEAPGAVPQASDTPSEVLARAVGNRTISTASAAALVDLFAEARFSRHTMTEDHRDEAEQALRAVLTELRSGRRA
jgi:disulfide bond formation protein DsbB